jgi:hypothetical protein
MMVWGRQGNEQGNQRSIPMSSETVARVLGAIVGAAALIIAFTFAPPWQAGKPEKPVQTIEPPKAQAIAPPARGPVVREIPQ